MPTAATFIPVLGQLDAPFAIASGDLTPVPRSVDPVAQGDPRAGVMRWVLLVTVPDPQANNDDEIRITVPIPESILFDADILATKANSVFPAITVTPFVSLLDPAGAAVSSMDPVARTLTVLLSLSTAAPTVWGGRIDIDFCHSSVN